MGFYGIRVEGWRVEGLEGLGSTIPGDDKASANQFESRSFAANPRELMVVSTHGHRIPQGGFQ